MNNEHQLYQKLGTMESDIKNIRELVDEVNRKVDTYNAISQRVTVLEERANDRSSRLRKLEDNQAKIVWAIVTAVLGAILKFVVVDGGIHK
jgi:hypothetical protein